MYVVPNSSLFDFHFTEPHNAISETDWQRLWQNAEGLAGHNKLDPNGLEVTDPPGYEETEVSNPIWQMHVGGTMRNQHVHAHREQL